MLNYKEFIIKILEIVNKIPFINKVIQKENELFVYNKNNIEKIYRLDSLYETIIEMNIEMNIEKSLLDFFIKKEDIFKEKELKNWIFPIIEKKNLNKQYIFKNYNEDLNVYYVLDIGYMYMFITNDILAKLNIEKYRLYYITINNLRKQKVKLKEIDNNVYLFNSGDMFCSARILLPEIYYMIKEEIKEDFYICIIDRFTVFIFTKKDITNFRQMLFYRKNKYNDCISLNIFSFNTKENIWNIYK